MSFQDVKKYWHWVWHSDSIWSWLVALVIIFIAVKFIFFPTLSLIFGNELPLAGVESSSMDHYSLKSCIRYDLNLNCIEQSSDYEICGKKFDKKTSLNFDKYWSTCGSWYEEKNITKEQFSKFQLKDGFRKGDVIIVWGRFTPKIGDIIVFKPNSDSIAPRPIIHRIVKINEDGTYQTKGDHNEKQLTKDNNSYKTDETHITKEQIIGKAVVKIPLLGYPKIWFTNFINVFR